MNKIRFRGSIGSNHSVKTKELLDEGFARRDLGGTRKPKDM